MTERKPVESRWPSILDIKLVPAAAHLPPTVPVERRNVAARHALVCRIQSEFEEMPGLSLTMSQAARLWGLSPDIAARIIERLAEARVLRRSNDGQFSLRVERP